MFLPRVESDLASSSAYQCPHLGHGGSNAYSVQGARWSEGRTAGLAALTIRITDQRGPQELERDRMVWASSWTIRTTPTLAASVRNSAKRSVMPGRTLPSALPWRAQAGTCEHLVAMAAL